MATLSVHSKDCLMLLGGEFREVHKFLDSSFDPTAPTSKKLDHRTKYHNIDGVKEVFQKFGGPMAATAAIIHILRDRDSIRPTVEEVEETIQHGLPEIDWIRD